MGFTIILGFIKDNWKVVLAAVLVIALVVYVEGLRVEIAMKDSKITSLESDLLTVKQNNATLTSALSTQNGAIDKIGELAAQTKKSFDALGVNVTQQTTQLDARLMAILKDKKPITCEDTIKYLIDASKGYKQ